MYCAQHSSTQTSHWHWLPYTSPCPCFPFSKPIPLSQCLDVRQTYQSPPRPPSINAGDIFSRGHGPTFPPGNGPGKCPHLAPITVPYQSPRGRRVSIKWCEVISWFWILSYVLRSAICCHSILLSIFLFWCLYRLPKRTSRDGPGGNRYPTVTQLPPGTWPSKKCSKNTAPLQLRPWASLARSAPNPP